MRSLPVLALVAVLAAPSFQWPVPEGWNNETIPFPLGFAPDLPYAGVEELRFAPGMFKPGEEAFWSYAFLWWLDGRPKLGAAELEDTLKRYFAGLITTVGKEKGYSIDEKRFRASIRPSANPPKKAGHAVKAFAGTVDSYDAFATGQPIVLNVEVWVWDCGGKRAALVLASPKAPTERIWKTLHERRDELACH